ncbi:hypothetical protein GQ56_0116395 [Burkholderia paludis]|uniref:hypothetical protein n=1 Tax=Burkholderia paludis TaxID=1506587 RepID=UPI0004DB8FAA|nr:hypothetical protein [Burkholderia paludis]KFG96188.1 hypothetical protein GQ56_0116395 [Burkholderia paludis]
MIVYPSIAGRVVPELRSLTRADLRWIFLRIRRDSRRRYYVALSLALPGSLAGATLLILPVFAGISFAMRGMLSASALSGLAGAVCGVIAVHVGYAIETALMTLQLKPEIAARLARDRLPAA